MATIDTILNFEKILERAEYRKSFGGKMCKNCTYFIEGARYDINGEACALHVLFVDWDHICSYFSDGGK